MGYNHNDANSIILYARKLEGKSLKQACGLDIENYAYRGKGNFGQILEKYYFEYEPNSISEPDFKEANLELKTSPLKVVNKVNLRAKERLVLGIINYLEIPKQEFFNSSFFKKNQHLLLVFYLHEEDVDVIDYIIKLVGDWKIPDADLIIIKNDWEKIKKKVISGLAHEISEGDTFYLGAATKGAKGGNLREQPKSSILAKQRAFAFKQGYLNHIIASISGVRTEHQYGKIIKRLEDIQTNSIEEVIIQKFEQFLNKSVDDLIKIFSAQKLNLKSKNFYSSLTKLMLGVSANQEIEELRKADIRIKTIRLKNNNLPKEDLSFPAFEFLELVKEEWDESDFKATLESKFLFIFFKYDSNLILRLEKVKFWNMSFSDISEAKKVWIKTKEILQKGEIVSAVKSGIRFTNFPDKKYNRISHVRPHAQNANDTFPLPFQDRLTKLHEYTKQSFWLNNTYIRDEIFLK